MLIVVCVRMNRKDLIEELHKLKEAITVVSDRVNEIDEDLISCGTNTDNMKNTLLYVSMIYMQQILI